MILDSFPWVSRDGVAATDQGVDRPVFQVCSPSLPQAGNWSGGWGGVAASPSPKAA